MLSDLSPGSPFWLPNGTHVWNELTKLWRTTNVERGYTEVRTPILYDVDLWKQSGHWHVYRENMYFTDVEGRPMGLKPMNCPAHVQIYKRELRSYRDLPIRWPSRASSTATSRAAPCTGCCACATSPRTTRTCSAPRSRSRRRCCAASTSASTSTTSSASSRGSSCPRAREAGRHRGDVGQGRGGAAARARAAGSSTSSTRATAPSTDRRSTST